MLVNGLTGNTISIRDRGLLYGDGVFRTLRAVAGRALHWPQHFQKLQSDCAKLGLICPAEDLLHAELEQLLQEYPDAVVKLIVTRGIGVRGYASPDDVEPTRVWDCAPLPIYPAAWATAGIKLHLCALRLSSQPRLAGVKHLNRLENVLAATELHERQKEEPEVAESLLLDEQGRVIEGTRSNLFLMVNGRLVTPELSRCGVAGIQRERVLEWARRQGWVVEVRDVACAEVERADELFLVNSVIGLWPVREFGQRRWHAFPCADRVRAALELEEK